MVNIMFCVFSIILKLWTQMDQQMRKQCCLAEKFSVLDSVAFRKCRCTRPSITILQVMVWDLACALQWDFSHVARDVKTDSIPPLASG